MAAWTPKYGTTSEIALLAGYNYADELLMAEVALAQEVIEEEVEQYCSTVFYAETGVARVYSGNDTNMLTLGYFLRTLTSVELLDTSGVVYDTLTDVVMKPDSPRRNVYMWLERRGNPDPINRDKISFPAGVSNIRVTGNWGFTTIPAPIKNAIALSVRHYFNLRNYDATKLSESGINRTIQLAEGRNLHYLHPISIKILDKWSNSRRWSE